MTESISLHFEIAGKNQSRGA